MKWLKKTWEYLSGKKVIIGAITTLGIQGIKAFAPELVDPEVLKFAGYAADIFLGVGVLHKGYKSDTVNNATKKAQTSYKNIGNSPKI